MIISFNLKYFFFQASTAKAPDFIGAVPVEIELAPLKEFCSSADAILVNIADSVIGKVSEMLVNLQGLDTYIRTLLETKPAKIYPAVASNLNLFHQYLTNQDLKIKEQLQALLPAIKARANGKSEKDVIELIRNYNVSPFNNMKSRIFLDSRSLEIKALNLLMEDLDSSTQDNFQIHDYQNPNQAALLLKYRKVVKFSVHILQSESITRAFLSGTNSSNSNSAFWYNDAVKASALGYQKYLFQNFISANKNSKEVGFLISINTRNETKHIDMHALKFGKPLGKGDFIIPDYPEKPKLVSRADKQFTVSVKNPQNPWVTKFYVEYWRFVDGADRSTRMEFQFFDSGINNITIKNLNPLTRYEYKIIYFTEFGVSPPSEINQVTTTPCSEPKNMRLGTVTENSLEIMWNIPVCGVGITINTYKVMLSGK